ncbi:CPBP family intramembrane metalloprotease [Undibacterium sp. LX40W]|uniref:CPBP family intramembrane metalloprotease n=1 Tax=Undibacterium nitidum TaxID=2762298 RepID=A0A923HW61_9BURK|nr:MULTISPECIES: type II CAAX endopeptidase family protein [Undibacterium]MBC3881231.1 CPBP family intramembrane metalloprotease [Undibacterium nitidum]MBC3890036.1 CPBP family intramembrane metalloprotease [Undibacterium sp. LX40W]
MIKRGLELYANREEHHVLTWTVPAIILTLVFLILGDLLSYIGFAIPGLRLAMPEKSWQETAYQLVFSFGLAALICFAWVRFFERRSLACIGFSAGGTRLYLRGLGLGFAFITAVVGVIYLLGGYEIEGTGILRQFSVAAVLPLLILFIGFMVQGATEEIFMRGWLFQLLTSRYGVTIGIVGNMIVFSAIHGLNIKPSPELAIGLFNIVLVAILLSYYALKEGTLWGVCAWHSAWNWLLGVGFGLEVSGQSLNVVPLFVDLKNASNMPYWLHGGAFGPEASVVTSVILLIGIFYFGSRKSHGKVFSVPGELAVDIKS